MFDWMSTPSLRKSKETSTFAKIYKIYDYAYVKKNTITYNISLYVKFLLM